MNRNYHTARINLGITLNEMGNYSEAVSEFESIQETPAIKTNPEALIAYGTALRNVEDYKLSSHQFEQALLINPRHSQAHNGLGIVYSKLARY